MVITSDSIKNNTKKKEKEEKVRKCVSSVNFARKF